MRPETRLGVAPTEADERDAVHIACVPAIARGKLFPGQEVGIVKTDWYGKERPGKIIIDRTHIAIGIVDPFLRESVQPGERCWLLLYPGSITSLRHAWTHPAFDGEEKLDFVSWTCVRCHHLFPVEFDPQSPFTSCPKCYYSQQVYKIEAT